MTDHDEILRQAKKAMAEIIAEPTPEQIASAEEMRGLMDQIEDVFEGWEGPQITGALKILLAEQLYIQYGPKFDWDEDKLLLLLDTATFPSLKQCIKDFCKNRKTAN